MLASSIPESAIPIHYAEIIGRKEDEINFKKLINSEIQVEIKL